MTASTAPAMPSEETLARWLCAHEGHAPDQVDGLWTEWLDNARDLLAMFGPAFEAKEREIARKHEAFVIASDQAMANGYSAACAKAKLAQAVEAEQSFARESMLMVVGELANRGVSEDLICEAIEAAADRASAAMGEKT